MVNKEEVISFYTELKKKVSEIEDPKERSKFIDKELDRYTLEEWSEVGRILAIENLY